MSQGYTTVPITGTHSAAEIVGDIQVNTDAVQTLNSGGGAPSSPVAYQWWADTNAGQLKQRDSTNANWVVRASLADTIVVARTSNTIIATGDMGRTFLCSTTFTQTLTAAATLGDGFWFRLRNNGTGLITIDPNSSETINGSTTLAVPPGGDCIIVCSGGAFYATTSGGAALRNITTLTATSSSVYTTPVGATKLRVIAVGGGGPGGNAVGIATAGACAAASGGGSGATSVLTISGPAATYSYQCGVGGTVGSGVSAGTPGGDTTFGALTAGGGGIGIGMGASTGSQLVSGGVGGTASGGDRNIVGGSGSSGATLPNTTIAISGMGGTSQYGAGGPQSVVVPGHNDVSPARSGTGYGAGGAGGAVVSNLTINGGAGTAGIIFVEEYY